MENSFPYPEDGRSLFRLLFVGILGWMLAAVGSIVWFFATISDAGLAAVAVPFYAWIIGFVPGGVVMFLYGVVKTIRRTLTLRTLAWACVLYFLPVVFATLLFKLFLSLLPLTIQGGNDVMMFSAFGGPFFFFLYCAGLLLGFVFRKKSLRQTVLAIVTPPAAGLCCAIGVLLWFSLTSPFWKNKETFHLEVGSVRWGDPGLIVEGYLKTNEEKAGLVHAFYRDRSGESCRGEPVDSVQFGEERFAKLEWTKKVLGFEKGEAYRFRLVWWKLRTTSLNTHREVIFTIREASESFNGALLKEFRIPADPDKNILQAMDSKLSPRGRDGKMGYVNRMEIMVIEPQFDWADDFSDGLAVVRIGQQWGYINEKGNISIELTYDYATRFSGGLAGVLIGRKSGYIDTNGKEVIPFTFDGVSPFHDSRARVRVEGKDGFIDRQGRLVIPPQWNWADEFSDGMAAVRVREKYGFIDTTGTMLIKSRFDAFQKFSEGKANVMLGNRWGVVDTKGNWSDSKD